MCNLMCDTCPARFEEDNWLCDDCDPYFWDDIDEDNYWFDDNTEVEYELERKYA